MPRAVRTSIRSFNFKLMSYKCMEHSIHVAGRHFIRGVGPTSSRNSRQKGKKAAVDPYDTDGGEPSGDEDDTGNVDDDGVAEFDAGDTVGKALALVTQVSRAPAHSHAWSNTVSEDPKVSTSTRVLPTGL